MIDTKALRVINREWQTCTKCPLGIKAFKHVLYELPQRVSGRAAERVDVLMIGEGPGRSEDTIGKPFCGKSGRLLRETITEAGGGCISIALTNLVACRPTDDGTYDRKPSLGEITACEPRLRGVIRVLDPLFIVCLGRVAEEYVPAVCQEIAYQGWIFHIPHPAFIGYNGGKSSSLYPEWKFQFEVLFNRVRSARESEGLGEAGRIERAEREMERLYG